MGARVLLLDIETAPNLAWTWGHFDQNIIEVEREWYILSFAWKFLGDKEVQVKSLPMYKTYKKAPFDDRALIEDLRELLDEADIVVAHNGDRFDIKKINVRILIHGLEPPSPYKTVDTLKVARRRFRFDSNNLNYLSQLLGLGKKVPHAGFALWKGCMAGDFAAWQTMEEYNKHDVELLEEIYLKLRPWSDHPDVTLYGHVESGSVRTPAVDAACPSCGGHHIQRRGTSVARSRKYQRLHCQDCGTWFQGAIVK